MRWPSAVMPSQGHRKDPGATVLRHLAWSIRELDPDTPRPAGLDGATGGNS